MSYSSSNVYLSQTVQNTFLDNQTVCFSAIFMTNSQVGEAGCLEQNTYNFHLCKNMLSEFKIAK